MYGILWKNKILFIFLFVLCICSCKTPEIPPEPIIKEPLVLLEIRPLPREVVIKPEVKIVYEPIYNIFKIIETNEENGVQKFFLVRMGSDKTNIVVGTAGDISANESFSEIIGTYKIIEVTGNFFRCQITNLTHKIGKTAYIRIQIGEKAIE